MTLRRFLADERGATAAEFALILPLMLVFLLGMTDVGFYMYQLNQTEKAAQMGVRYAAVSNFVASDLATRNYIGSTACGGTLAAGDTICAAALSPVSCGSSGDCTCTGNCPALTRNADAFNGVLARVKAIAPWVQATNVKVEYRGSGLGFAGDPDVQIAPIVTVKLQNLTYRPLSAFVLPVSVAFPMIVRSVTMEDARGTRSN